ncbi:MAG TPA: TonB-dependent receptor, partial [Myxococcales bacterium]|nr:TonB-dependent receptor [Myxococcales bacterium]
MIQAAPRKDGSHILTGLEPGEYLLTAAADGREVFQIVTVQVGQNLNVRMDMAMEGQVETVVVKGHLVETSTSEVAVNISRETMDSLPQLSRNFVNFAGLAPGVRVNNDEFRKDFSSGATDSTAINVFVDGISLKQNVISGGLVGQDASRGNPFPQLALSGFRLITQNYKAEYEQAGGAIVAATTKSGGNDFHGEVLGVFQNQYLAEQDYFSLKRGEPPADLGRLQIAGALSGPILKDKIHFFATYEGNYEQRANRVSIGNPTPENQQRFGAFEGAFPSPFREHLAFGKLTWHVADGQTVDVTTSYRTETDIRGFGDRTSYQAAENVKNNVLTATARHEWWLPMLTNEATFQFLESHFNPVVLNDGLIGQNFRDVVRIGGRDTTQDISQRAFTLRDDVTFPAIEAMGPHVVKTGAKLSFQRYHEIKKLFGNPLFHYRVDSANNLDFSFPFEADYGIGDPTIFTNNTQIGLYVQDDWQPFKQLTVNVGIRWDVETAPLNNGYVTPQNVRDAVTQLAQHPDIVANGPDFFPVDKYLTDGTQRPPFLGAIQPRLGLAFDVFGDGSTVLFGGAGRYYDRTLYNTVVDEPYRLQYQVRKFRFSADGSPRDGLPTIQWQNSYLSKEGLDGLIASGTAPNPEIFLIQNDLKPMHTDQFSAGVRRLFGPLSTSLTATYVHGENGVGFYPANRKATSPRDFIPVPGFGNVLISDNNRETRYASLQVSAEKPFNADLAIGGVQWGGSLAYTFGVAREQG